MFFYRPQHFFGTTRAIPSGATRLSEETLAEEADKPRIFLVERRRTEKRLPVNVAIEVTFETGEGSGPTERTFIEDVSDFGCRFTTRQPARQGDRLALKFVGATGQNLPDVEARHYEIMWVAPHGKGSTVGARLVRGEKPVEVEILSGASEQSHSSK